MNQSTDAPQEAASVAPARESATEGKPAAAGKPRFALFIATAGGLGYMPKAPGTFGSLAGLVLTILPSWALAGAVFITFSLAGLKGPFSFVAIDAKPFDVILWAQILLAFLVAGVGVWSSSRAGEFWQIKDPQRVVIDEVSGQHLTLLLGCALPTAGMIRADAYNWSFHTLGLVTARSALSWKYLLLGFILFRAFDIWKPFPARQAESLPGGWGIMADDWIAGIYAAIGLWI
ncbi:MAG TPA: phosphatidylglycerophosphatase A, partial [Candidatus Acidoferrales bacterium]|nr:phosphatidylglycerophosphatase A [Candidatus Acidoferrales bacterium]